MKKLLAEVAALVAVAAVITGVLRSMPTFDHLRTATLAQHALTMTFAAALALTVFFIPTTIARRRQHRNATGIFLVNLFAGWTLIGWVGALVWAVYNERKTS